MAEVARKLQCRFVGHNCGSAPAPGMSTDEKAEQIKALAALIDTVASEMEDIRWRTSSSRSTSTTTGS